MFLNASEKKIKITITPFGARQNAAKNAMEALKDIRVLRNVFEDVIAQCEVATKERDELSHNADVQRQGYMRLREDVFQQASEYKERVTKRMKVVIEQSSNQVDLATGQRNALTKQVELVTAQRDALIKQVELVTAQRDDIARQMQLVNAQIARLVSAGAHDVAKQLEVVTAERDNLVKKIEAFESERDKDIEQMKTVAKEVEEVRLGLIN